MGGGAGNILPYLLPFSSQKRKGMLFYSNHDLKYHQTQQSLRAESELQAIVSGTSAASEYWFPLSPKARQHKKLLCVLGGVQKRWKPGKEIQGVAMKPSVNITMESLNPLQLQWDPTHIKEHPRAE